MKLEAGSGFAGNKAELEAGSGGGNKAELEGSGSAGYKAELEGSGSAKLEGSGSAGDQAKLEGSGSAGDAKLEASGSAGDQAKLEAELTDCSLDSEEVTEASTDLSAADSMFLGFLICFVLVRQPNLSQAFLFMVFKRSIFLISRPHCNHWPTHPGVAAASSSALGTDQPLPKAMVTWKKDHVFISASCERIYVWV